MKTKKNVKKAEYIKGDLFNADVDERTTIIAHVCNNLGVWGAGFVVPLGRYFPEAKEAYTNWCSRTKDKESLLGLTQFVKCDETIVANMIAQTMGGKRPLHYPSLCDCMEKVAMFALQHDAVIHCPLFGSMLAGGNWDFIQELIKDIWLQQNIDVRIFYLEKDENLILPYTDEGEDDLLLPESIFNFES